MKKDIFILAGIFLISSGISKARPNFVINSGSNVVLPIQDNKTEKTIFKYNSRSKQFAIYYEMPVSSACLISNSSLDSTGDKILIIGACEISNKKDNFISGSSYRFLKVIDERSKIEVAEIKNVGEAYSFSPSGDAIVFSERKSEACGSSRDTNIEIGLFLLDFSGMSKKRIDTIGLLPSGDYCLEDVYWSPHDNNIYYTNYNGVIRYNTRSGRSEITPYKGIYFSYNGQYYSAEIYEGSCRLYRTADNAEMKDWENAIVSNGPKDFPGMAFKFWSKKLNSGVFSVNPSDTKNVVFDVGEGRVIGQFSGKVIGTNAEGTLVAIYPISSNGKLPWDNSKIEIIDLTKFKK